MSHDIRKFFGGGSKSSRRIPNDSRIEKAFKPKTPEKKVQDKRPKESVAGKSNGAPKKETFGSNKRPRTISSSSEEELIFPTRTVQQVEVKEKGKVAQKKPAKQPPKVEKVQERKPQPKAKPKDALEKVEKRKETGVDLIEEYPSSSQATSKSPAKKTSRSPAKKPRMDESTAPKSIQIQTSKSISPQCVPWVEKYRPTNMKQILGQQGDKSCMKKLSQWLRDWPKWHITGEKQKRFSKDGFYNKAALLSGPPGIGKTTTAEVVCKELGLNFLALNASDVRNKKSLEQSVSEFLSSHSIQEFWHGGSSKPHPPSSKKELKNVLILDEVDGMSGNEDRAGIAELIALIKSTRIPIICICNDRYIKKIQSLAEHCYDLKFDHPKVDQIRSGILSILFKEEIKLPRTMVDQIIESSGNDIRQVLNRLNFLAATGKGLTNMEDAKNAVLKKETFRKDETANVFKSISKLFLASEKLTLKEKTELFFSDYNLMPLFVHENYLNVDPEKARTVDCLERISKAADLISMGDTIDQQIRSDQNWSLLDQMAIFSTVLPCDLMRGRIMRKDKDKKNELKIEFPSWFGKHSKQDRMERLAQQLNFHTSSKVSASSTTWAMDYAPAFRQSTTDPLLRYSTDDGVRKILQTMDAYDLTMEDRESILELTKWPGMPDSAADLKREVKKALKREYEEKHKDKQKLPYALPYASAVKRIGKKKKGKQVAMKNVDADLYLEEEDGDEEMDVF